MSTSLQPADGPLDPHDGSPGESEAMRLAQASVDRHHVRTSPTTGDPAHSEDVARLMAALAMLGAEAHVSQGAAADEGFCIGKYSVLGERGRGGFGMVLRAYDPDLHREVALKLPRPERLLNGEPPEEILREARMAAQLEHPGIVPVYETGRWGPVWYIAAAYCPGQSLGEWMRSRTAPPPETEAAWLIAEAAAAIHHAHARGVLHLDLKPDNILLKEDPSRYSRSTPVITDFGMSGWSRNQREPELGRIGGTPDYMAPEQTRGDEREIGVASDVYALGAILVDLLSGRGNACSPESSATRRRISDLPTRTSPDLAAVAQKCLADRPADRYASAKELGEDLRRYLAGETLLARPVGRAVRTARWARRKPALATSLGVLALAIIVGLATAGTLWRRAEQNLARFQLEAERRSTAEARVEASVLNLAWVAQKARLVDPDCLADASQDLLAIQTFLEEMRNWNSRKRGSCVTSAGIEAARHSLALFEKPADLDAKWRREFRQGLQAWQEVVVTSPNCEQWNRAFAAHLLTYCYRFAPDDWLSWRSDALGLDRRVIQSLELPYAEFLIEVAQSRGGRHPSGAAYRMLQAAVQLLAEPEGRVPLDARRTRLLLAARNLASESASLLANRADLAAHRAAADELVAHVESPEDCPQELAAVVAATYALQGSESEAAGDQATAIAKFSQAAAYLVRAIADGAGSYDDHLRLASVYVRIGRCHRALDDKAADRLMCENAIQAFDAALALTAVPIRTVQLQRATPRSRYGRPLLAAGLIVEALAQLEASEAEFTEVKLRPTDTKNAWLTSVQTSQALGKLYESTGRLADGRQAYRSSLQQLAELRTFTRHPSVHRLTIAGEAALTRM